MRVLLLGGTGAMGRNLSRELVSMGHETTVTSRVPHEDADGIRYVVGNAMDQGFLADVLGRGWDAVVDFMVRYTKDFRLVMPTLLAGTGQYLFVSSYRVYADSPVITEESPRLLDVVNDHVYLATDEYALAKARCEDLLRASRHDNWTIARPAITYDGGAARLQLGVMESTVWLWRAQHGAPVPFPKDMLARQATMSWGCDVARMIARLIGNPDAFGEAYTVSGSDHMAWADVAKAYQTVLPFELTPCNLEEFIDVVGTPYQVIYDRMYNRVVDNSKVLAATGMSPEDLTPMRDGLIHELRACLDSGGAGCAGAGLNARLDRLTGGCYAALPMAGELGLVGLAKYVVRRAVG